MQLRGEMGKTSHLFRPDASQLAPISQHRCHCERSLACRLEMIVVPCISANRHAGRPSEMLPPQLVYELSSSGCCMLLARRESHQAVNIVPAGQEELRRCY